MTTFNVTGGGGFERHKLEHESRHNAVVKEVQEIRTMPDYNDPAVGIDKIPIVFEIDGKDISMLATNKVTKGSGSFSNSKMYDVMDKAGIIDNFIELFKEGEVSDNDVLEFLRGRIVGRTCEIEIKNANKGKDNEYSSISKIVKFSVAGESNSPAPEKVANAEETKKPTETKN